MASRRFKKEGILPVVLGLAALGVASYFLLFAPELRTIGSLRAGAPAQAGGWGGGGRRAGAAGGGGGAPGEGGSRGSPVPPHVPVHLPGPRGVPRRDPARAAPADDPVGVGQGKGGRHDGGYRAVGLAPEGA